MSQEENDSGVRRTDEIHRPSGRCALWTARGIEIANKRLGNIPAAGIALHASLLAKRLVNGENARMAGALKDMAARFIL